VQNKKLLGSTLALAMILPSASVNAELLKNFKLSGQLDLQGTSAHNVTDFATRATLPAGGGAANNDRIGDMQTRVLVHADWDVLDDVHAKVTLGKNNRSWGTGGANAHGNAQAETVGAGGIQAGTFVDQAYVKIDKVFGAVDTTLGRQFYGTSGDLIVYFGPSDKALWGMPVNALDTARFDWANDMVGLTGVVGKIAGANTTAAAIPHAGTDIRGLVASIKAAENISAGAYVYNRVIHALGAAGTAPTQGGGAVGAPNGGKNDNLWVAGLKGKWSAGGLWTSAEFAKNFGENRGSTAAKLAAARNYVGWAAKLDGGYKADMGGVGAVQAWGHFGYGSGDGDANSSHNNGFVAINGDYRPGSIYGRFANAQGAPLAFGAGLSAPAVYGFGAGANTAFAGNGTLTNRVIWGLGAKVTPEALNKFTAGVAFWDFKSQTALLPNIPVGAGPDAQTDRVYGGNKHIGSEVDLDLEWKHSENVSFMTGAGYFLPGGAIKEAVQATSATSNSGAAQANGIGNNPAKMAYFDVRIKF
jgi:hypothetical protein